MTFSSGYLTQKFEVIHVHQKKGYTVYIIYA